MSGRDGNSQGINYTAMLRVGIDSMGFTIKEKSSSPLLYTVESVSPDLKMVSVSPNDMRIMPNDEIVSVSLQSAGKAQFNIIETSHLLEMPSTLSHGGLLKLHLHRPPNGGLTSGANGSSKAKVGSAAIKGLIASAKATANNARRGPIEVENEEKKVPRTTAMPTGSTSASTASTPSSASDNSRNEIFRLKKELQQSVPKSQLLESERKYKELKKQLDEANQKLRASEAAYQRLAAKLKGKGGLGRGAGDDLSDFSESDVDVSVSSMSSSKLEASIRGIESLKKHLHDDRKTLLSESGDMAHHLAECQNELERVKLELSNSVSRAQFDASERLCAELKRLCEGPGNGSGSTTQNASPVMLRMLKAQLAECESKLSSGDFELKATKQRLAEVEEANNELSVQMTSVKLVLDDASSELMKMSKQMATLKASAEAKVKKLEERLEREVDLGRQASERVAELEQKLIDSRMVCDAFMTQVTQASASLEASQERVQDLEKMLKDKRQFPNAQVQVFDRSKSGSADAGSEIVQVKQLQQQLSACFVEKQDDMSRIITLEEQLSKCSKDRDDSRREIVMLKKELRTGSSRASQESLVTAPDRDQSGGVRLSGDGAVKALERANERTQEQDSKIEYLKGELEKANNDLLEARKALVQRSYESPGGVAGGGESETSGMATQLLRLKRQLQKKDTDMLELSQEIGTLKQSLALLQLTKHQSAADGQGSQNQASKISDLSAELSRRNELLADKDNRIRELERECNCLEESLGTQMRLIKLREEQMTEMSSAPNTAENTTHGVDYPSNLVDAHNKIGRLTCQMEGMTIALEMLNNQLESKSSPNSSGENYDGVSNENAALRDRLLSSESFNTQLQKEVAKLKQELNVSKQHVLTADANLAMLDEKRVLVDTRAIETAQLKDALKTSENMLRKKENEVLKLREELETSQSRSTKEGDLFSGISDRKIAILESQLLNATETINRLTAQLDHISNSCDEKTQGMSIANSSISVVRASLTEARRVIVDMEYEKARLSRSIAGLEVDLMESRRVGDEHEKLAVSLREANRELEKQTNQLRVSKMDLETRLSDTLRRNVEMREEMKAEMEIAVLQASKQNSASTGDASILKEEIISLKKSLLSKVPREHLDEAEKRGAEMQRQISDIRRALDSSASTLTRMSKEKAELEQRLSQCQKTVDELRRAEREGEKRCAELQKALSELNITKDENYATMRDLLSTKSMLEISLAEVKAQLGASAASQNEANTIKYNPEIDLSSVRDHYEQTVTGLLDRVSSLEADLAKAEEQIANKSSQLLDSEVHCHELQQLLHSTKRSLDIASSSPAEATFASDSYEALLHECQQQLAMKTNELIAVNANASALKQKLDETHGSSQEELIHIKESLEKKLSEANSRFDSTVNVLRMKITELEGKCTTQDAQTKNWMEKYTELERRQGSTEIGLGQKCAELKAIADDWKIRCEDATNRLSACKTSLSDTQDTLKSVIATKDDLTAELVKVNAKLTEKTKKVGDLTDKVSDLQKQLEFTKTMLDKTATSLAATKSSKDAAESVSTQFQQQLVDAIANRGSLEARESLWQQQVEETNTAIEEANTRISCLGGEIEQLNQKLTSAQQSRYKALTENAELAGWNKALEARLALAERSLQEGKGDLTKVSSDMSNRIKELQDELECVWVRVDQTAEDLRRTTEQKTALEQEFAVVQHAVDAKEEEITSLKDHNLVLQSELSLTKKQRKDDQYNLATMADEKSNLAGERDKLKEQLEQMRNMIEELRRSGAEMNSSFASIETERLRWKTELDMQRRNFESDIQQLQDELDFTKVVLDDTANTLAATRAGKETLDSNVSNMMTKYERDTATLKSELLAITSASDRSLLEWQSKNNDLESMMMSTVLHWERRYADLEKSSLLDKKKYDESYALLQEELNRTEAEWKEQYTNLKVQFDNTRQSLTGWNDAVALVSGEKELLEKEMFELRRESERNKAELAAALRSSKSLYEETLIELEQTKDQLDSECNENVTLVARKRDAENEVSSVRLEALQTIQRLQDNIAALEKDLIASQENTDLLLMRSQKQWDLEREKMQMETQNMQKQLDFSKAVLDETAGALSATKLSKDCMEAELVDTKQQLDTKVRALVKTTHEWEAKCTSLDALLMKTNQHWEQRFEEQRKQAADTKEKLETQIREDKRFHEMQLAHIEAAHRIECEEAAARLGQVKQRLAETEHCLEEVVAEKFALNQAKTVVEGQLATVSRALKETRGELGTSEESWINRHIALQSELEEMRLKHEQLTEDMLAMSATKITLEGKLTGARAIIDQLTNVCGDSDTKVSAMETESLILKKDFEAQRKKMEERFAEEKKLLQQQLVLMRAELDDKADALVCVKATKMHLETELSSLDAATRDKIEDLMLMLADADDKKKQLSLTNAEYETRFRYIESILVTTESKWGYTKQGAELGERCIGCIDRLEAQIEDMTTAHNSAMMGLKEDGEAKVSELNQLLCDTNLRLDAVLSERNELATMKLGLESVLEDTRKMMCSLQDKTEGTRSQSEVAYASLEKELAESRQEFEERYRRMEERLSEETSALDDQLLRKTREWEGSVVRAEELVNELNLSKALMNDTVSAMVQLKCVKLQLEGEVADLKRSLDSSTNDLCRNLVQLTEECRQLQTANLDWERKYDELESMKKYCETQIAEMAAEYRDALESFAQMKSEIIQKNATIDTLKEEVVGMNNHTSDLTEALVKTQQDVIALSEQKDTFANDLSGTREVLVRTEEEMKAVCADLQSRLETTEHSLERVQEGLANVTVLKINIEAEYQEYRKKSEITIEEMMRASQSEIESSGEKAADLQKRLTEMRETARTLNEQLQEKVNEAVETREQLVSAQNHIGELDNRVEELNRFLNEIATANGKLTSEVSYLSECKTRLVETEDKLAYTNQMLEASVSRAELVASEARCEQLQRQIQILKSTLDDTSEQLTNFSATEDELVAAKKMIQARVPKEQYVVLEVKCEELTQEVNSMERIIDSLQEKLKEKDVLFTRQAKQTEDVRWQLQDRQIRLDEMNSVDNELKRVVRRLKDANDQITTYENSERAMHRTIDQMNEAIQQLTSSNMSKETAIAQMVVEMKDKTSRASILQAKCEELETHVTSLEGILDDLRNQNSALEDVVSQSRQEDAYMQSKIVQQLEQIENAASERVSRVRMEVEEKISRSYCDQIMQLQSKIMELESKNVKVLTELSVAASKLEKANDRCVELEAEAKHANSVTPEQHRQLEDRCADLQRRLNDMRETRNAIKASLKEKEDELTDCTRKLESCRLQLAATKR